MTARIVLVRHAEPARSARGRAIGRTDVGLSRKGARQARELASNLAATGVDRVVSSPSIRAIRTAEPIARACGVPLEVDDDLREIDFGAFDGRTFASIEREHPGLYATWMRAPTAVVFPDGETWPALRERAERATQRIAKTGEGRTTVAVTHLGVILATSRPRPSRGRRGRLPPHHRARAAKLARCRRRCVGRPLRVCTSLTGAS